jgi:hypothetical protein
MCFVKRDLQKKEGRQKEESDNSSFAELSCLIRMND